MAYSSSFAVDLMIPRVEIDTKKIHYRLYGAPMAEQIPIPMFAVRKGFKWIEEIAGFDAPTMILNPDYYEIRELGGSLGCGVFAREPRPKGTIMSLYAGELEEITRKLGFCAYGVMSPDEEHLIDATNAGNVTRFFNHLPTSPQQVLSKENKQAKMLEYNSNVATANVLMNENMELYLCTEAKPGEQLGIDYGSLYWDGSPDKPVLFHKDSSGVLQCALGTCSNTGVYRCKKCKKIRYCSKECQRSDWPEHKVACRQKCHYALCSEPLNSNVVVCRLRCTAKYCSEKCLAGEYSNHINHCLSGVNCSVITCPDFSHEWYSCCKEMRFCGGHCYRAGLKLNPLHQCDATLRQRTQYLTADF